MSNYDSWDSFIPTLSALKIAGVLTWSWPMLCLFAVMWIAIMAAISTTIEMYRARD